jgi:hypothetical protein
LANNVPIGKGDAADPYAIAAIQEDEEAADPFLEPERDSVLTIDYAPAGTSYRTISEVRVGKGGSVWVLSVDCLRPDDGRVLSRDRGTARAMTRDLQA